MKLYFYGTNRRENREEAGGGIISFAIPDIGFVFRSAHKGTAPECEYQSLLTLCLFVEANAGLFKGQKLEILGDSAAVVYQVGQGGASAPSGPQHRFLERISAFKKKLGFSIFWVPTSENRAAEQTALHPTVKNFPLAEKLNTSFLEAFKTKPNPEPGFSPF